MGSRLSILDISLIMTGSLCHVNASREYVTKLETEIETCSTNGNCHKVCTGFTYSPANVRTTSSDNKKCRQYDSSHL